VALREIESGERSTLQIIGAILFPLPPAHHLRGACAFMELLCALTIDGKAKGWRSNVTWFLADRRQLDTGCAPGTPVRPTDLEHDKLGALTPWYLLRPVTMMGGNPK
jgi:hypothetical protein